LVELKDHYYSSSQVKIQMDMENYNSTAKAIRLRVSFCFGKGAIIEVIDCLEDDFLMFLEMLEKSIFEDDSLIVMDEPGIEIQTNRLQDLNENGDTYFRLLAIFDAGIFGSEMISTSTGPAICLISSSGNIINFKEGMLDYLNSLKLN